MHFFQGWSQSVQASSTRNVLAPLVLVFLILVGAVVATSLGGADPFIVHGLFWAAAATLVFLLAAYAYFGWTNPERLHSEKHRLDTMRLQARRQSPKGEPRIVSATPPVPNPVVLEHQRDTENRAGQTNE